MSLGVGGVPKRGDERGETGGRRSWSARQEGNSSRVCHAWGGGGGSVLETKTGALGGAARLGCTADTLMPRLTCGGWGRSSPATDRGTGGCTAVVRNRGSRRFSPPRSTQWVGGDVRQHVGERDLFSSRLCCHKPKSLKPASSQDVYG